MLAAPFLFFPTQFPLLTALSLFLLVAVWFVDWQRTGRLWPRTPFNAALLIWAIMIGVGVLVSADPDLTLPKLTGLLLGIALYRFFSGQIQGQRALLAVWATYVLVGVGMMGLGVFSADWRMEVPIVRALFPVLPSQLLTIPGITEAGIHTNQLAAVTLFYLPPAVALIARPTLSRYWRLASGLASLLLLLLLFLTQSRSAWAGALVGLGMLPLLFVVRFLWAQNRRRTLALLLLLLLLFLAGSTYLAWPTIQQALAEPPAMTAIGTLSTLPFRYEVWQWALVTIGDFPFTGTGLGTFRHVLTRLYPVFYPIDIAHAHNIFLQVALDTGLPGLVAYLALLLLAAGVSWQIALKDERLRPPALGLLASLVAFHVYGLTDALAPGSKPGIIFWMILGLLSAMHRLVHEKEVA